MGLLVVDGSRPLELPQDRLFGPEFLRTSVWGTLAPRRVPVARSIRAPRSARPWPLAARFLVLGKKDCAARRDACERLRTVSGVAGFCRWQFCNTLRSVRYWGRAMARRQG